jgi:hypothetical protein
MIPMVSTSDVVTARCGCRLRRCGGAGRPANGHAAVDPRPHQLDNAVHAAPRVDRQSCGGGSGGGDRSLLPRANYHDRDAASEWFQATTSYRRGPGTDPRRRERAEGPDDGSRRPPVRWLLRRRREYRPVSKPLRRLSMRLPIPDPHDGADYTCAPCCRLACSWSRSATIPDLDPRSAHGRYSCLNGEQIQHRSAANRRGSPGFRLNADPFKRGPHVGEEHHPHWSAHAAGRSPRPRRS